jgi:hypothetical protein
LDPLRGFFRFLMPEGPVQELHGSRPACV